MSAILEEDQFKGTSNEFKDGESVFEFYGGMVWKQTEYTSPYHYCDTLAAAIGDGDSQEYLNSRGPIQFFNFKAI